MDSAAGNHQGEWDYADIAVQQAVDCIVAGAVEGYCNFGRTADLIDCFDVAAPVAAFVAAHETEAVVLAVDETEMDWLEIVGDFELAVVDVDVVIVTAVASDVVHRLVEQAVQPVQLSPQCHRAYSDRSELSKVD